MPNIKIKSREDTNNSSMVKPEPHSIAGLHVRSISLGSLEILREMGNPIANGSQTENLTMGDISQFVWVHAAEEETVLDTVYNKAYLLSKTVAKFCLNITQEDIQKIVVAIRGDQSAIATASAIPLPDDHDSPNELSPHSSQA